MTKEELKFVGKSIPPMELLEKVTGRYLYVGDMPAELHAKILRSPYPHARIKNIDTSKVERLEGVEAVLTHKDVPRRELPRRDQRCCYILEDHLRFVGDEVAAVAAKTRAIAEEALDLFEVEYEVLPAVFDPEEAARPDAPELYPGGNVFGPQFGMIVEKNINEPIVLEWGDIGEGFREADVVIEDKVEVKPQVHSTLEPHICVASWKGDELILWTATQSPYEVRASIAHALGMPEGKVRVIHGAIGGGFGSKYIERYQPIVVVGGSARFSEESPGLAYKYPNARFEGWDVNTNHFTCQPYRSIALPALTFAVEQVIDQIAEELGMDPAEFRMRNLPNSGDMMPIKTHKNPIYPRAKLDVYPVKQIMKEVMEKIGWKRFKGHGQPIAIDGPKRRSIGIVVSQGWGGFCIGGLINETVILNNDGSVQILSGHSDIGTGSNTTLRQIAAEALGIPLEDVTIVSGDRGTLFWLPLRRRRGRFAKWQPLCSVRSPGR